jgi:5-methylcytosine-specific restriction endonuclease McrA
MKSKLVWVELDLINGLAVRIFRNRKEALSAVAIVDFITKVDATRQIRRAVFIRDIFACVKCGKALSWSSGHMHERIAKGKEGEVSLDNSELRCYDCHLLDEVSGHGNRRPKFTKTKNK